MKNILELLEIKTDGMQETEKLVFENQRKEIISGRLKTDSEAVKVIKDKIAFYSQPGKNKFKLAVYQAKLEAKENVISKLASFLGGK